ncbi:unnamed protein product [Auanema sp. JU1783]|nr:unnamed protein product [Auanema sp. JU1783]
MKHFVIFVFLLLNSITDFASGNELSRCCSGGSRHFLQTSTCSNIKSEGTSLTCVRAASICCLRALLDDACDDGAQLARQDDTCHTNINVLGGGLRKECCDCCLLAKDLIKRNEPCIPPTGFSAACLKAFSKCCSEKPSMSDGEAVLELGDRCSTAKCDHLCNDRGGDSVECSCRVGYELGPDGTTCVDIDECSSRTPPCQWGMEECVNTDGGYECEKRNLYDNRRIIRMRDESRRRVSTNAQRHQDLLMRDAPARPSSHYSSRHFDPQTHHKGWPCNKGYSLQNGICRDVDECNLGAHDCGVLYQCRNTQGSYRCDPKKCGEGELQNPQTGECTSIECPLGFYPKNGMCNDVDECAEANRCGPAEQCINTPGSYRCQEMGNMCAEGYQTNRNTGFCEDIDECMQNACGSLQCINMPGSYKCRCPAGYDFDEKLKKCEDINECEKFAGHVCDLSAECRNTIGSFICKCKAGFQLAADGRRCEDVNECDNGQARCEQKCVNIPGSYQCICDRGFALGSDGITCQDIDECSIWAGSGNDLCMGGCINTRGSYLCQCPPGYKIQADGRTCVDIDECQLGECQGNDRICVNTLGQFKCNRIECPHNYIHDSSYKNNIQDGYSCLKNCSSIEDAACIANSTREILYQFRAIPSLTVLKHPLEISRIRAHMEIPFSVEYILDARSQRYFNVEQDRNIGIVRLTRPIEGPTLQTVRVNIHTKSRRGVILSYNVAIIEIYISKYNF